MNSPDSDGRISDVVDVVTAAPLKRLAALLDHDGAHWPAGKLPPLGHWLFNLPDARQSALGEDGHPARGDLLPPIDLPRRMWAGGRIEFIGPIAIGATIRRRTTIAAVAEKKPGAMTLVTLLHEIFADERLAVREEQDLVYLPIAPPAAPRVVERPMARSSRAMVAGPILLFRYSALTFNAHRIHYDADYARDVEHYPGLVVHGPLQATLIVDQALRESVEVRHFTFRARAPLYAGERFAVARAGGEAWIARDDGTVTMTATIE